MASLLSSSGSTNNTMDFLKEMVANNLLSDLEPYGQQGVNALAMLTPIDTGLTATSWGYEITVENDRVSISWFNTNENDGALIAILLQYGHATGKGGYVSGIDYINPAMKPTFDQIAADVWRKVTLA